MANHEHLDILKQGLKVWFEWRKKNFEIQPDLSDADLRSANLSGANLSGADLSFANLSFANLSFANLSDADLFDADLSDTEFHSANLSHTNLSRANLYKASLSGANLSSANLSSANLSNTDLSDANLSNANLSNADLTRAGLSDANLSSANLGNANLSSANLSDADLNSAFLFKVDLSDADLSRANLYDADIGDAIFANLDLSTVSGLETCRHLSPSIINNQTLQQSGPLPKEFLKGIGLSDWEIEHSKLYQPDLNPEEIAEILNTVHQLRADSPIQVHNLFISYSHRDTVFVDKIASTLDARGIRFWRDIKGLQDAPAGPLDKILVREMKGHIVLLVLSKNSITRPWVRFEMESAADMSINEGRDGLLPIALDDNYRSYNWPDRLKQRLFAYNIIDFSEWEEDKVFKKRLEQVIEGLDLFY